MARNDKTTSTTQAFFKFSSKYFSRVNVRYDPVRWQRPQHDRVKCNVDASFYEQLNITYIVICIRDDGGTFVLANTLPITSMCTVVVGEALGLFDV